MGTRISQLHKTAAEWETIILQYEARNETFIPCAGELIIYDPDETFKHARLKIGDGNTALQNLPFLVEAAIAEAAQVHRYIDAGRIN
jgi:hypothetical protein